MLHAKGMKMPKSKSRNKRHSNQFSRQEQRYDRNSKEQIAWVYSALAIVLHKRHGFGQKRITDVLTDVQNIFVQNQNNIAAIVRQAYQETGLILMSEATAKELGINLEGKVKI